MGERGEEMSARGKEMSERGRRWGKGKTRQSRRRRARPA